MERRGKGEGSIRLRADGRWEATLSLPPAGGKRRRKSYFGRTRTEVARLLREALKATDEGIPIPNERTTVGGYLREWLAAKDASLRPESLRRYRDACELHLIPALGHVRLKALSPLDVDGAYAKLRAKGLSGTTLSLIHGVLHKALQDAARKGSVTRNVAALADKPGRTTPTMDTLRPEEAQRLLAAAEGDPLEALYVLALTTGMRLGELQALRWRSVDLERRRLQVVATYQGNVAGLPVFGEPKTAKSKRGVHLTELATSALRAHRARQAEQRLLAGPAWTDVDLCFTNGLGRPLDGDNLRRRSFARLLERAGLPPMRFHSLRHGVATLLMADGVPIKAISELLGHADISTTLRTYAHVLETTQQEARDSMERRFAAPKIGGQVGGQTL